MKTRKVILGGIGGPDTFEVKFPDPDGEPSMRLMVWRQADGSVAFRLGNYPDGTNRFVCGLDVELTDNNGLAVTTTFAAREVKSDGTAITLLEMEMEPDVLGLALANV